MKSWVNYYYNSCITTKKYFGGLSHVLTNTVDNNLSRRSACVSSPLNLLSSSYYFCYNSSLFKPDNVRSSNFNRSSYMNTKNSYYNNFRFKDSIDCDFSDVYRHFFGSSLNNRSYVIGLRNSLNTRSTNKILNNRENIKPNLLKYVDYKPLTVREVFKRHLFYPYMRGHQVTLPFKNKPYFYRIYNESVNSKISIFLLNSDGNPIKKSGSKRFFASKLYKYGYNHRNIYTDVVTLFRFHKRYTPIRVLNSRQVSRSVLYSYKYHFYYSESAPSFVRRQSAHNFNYLFTLHYFYNYSKSIN